jgi:hypothetical protein
LKINDRIHEVNYYDPYIAAIHSPEKNLSKIKDADKRFEKDGSRWNKFDKFDRT